MSPLFTEKLDQIEEEIRRIGYWQESKPDLQAKVLRGEVHSYVDAPSFESWLQMVFIPNARRAIVTDRLPADSQLGLMAMRQYDFHSLVPEALGLMRLLSEFDDLVRRFNR